MADPVAALAEVADARVAEAFPTQAELLGLPDVPARHPLAGVVASRPGRPAGARNRRSEDVAAYVIERLGDPLIRQAAVATMALDDLMARTGMSAAEALAEQRLAAALVLPYLHRRMPLAVDFTDHKIVHLTINRGSATAASTVAEIVEDQPLIEGDPDAV